jgi:UDP-GlcNAc3NAcA epimerase
VKKIVTVLGARPQFVKSGPVSAALAEVAREVTVNTGQHYDYDMSDVFFRDLSLKRPDYNLNIGSGSHALQTGMMLRRVEEVMQQEKPDIVLVYGDTNSTLAGALAAAKLQIPVAHVEAGLRSFNRAMPEEINRVLTDHVSSLLFAPSDVSVRQLESEGITNGVHLTGDVMFDATLCYAPKAARVSPYPKLLDLEPGRYYLCTVHRAENTDDGEKLRQIFRALTDLRMPVVLPLHPRTRKRLREFGIDPGSNIHVTDPVGYIDMLQLLQSSALVLTDSGGLQKEAYYLGVPCVTLREETEWVETVEAGWNWLAGQDERRITSAISAALEAKGERPQLYGDGKAAERIAEILGGDAS